MGTRITPPCVMDKGKVSVEDGLILSHVVLESTSYTFRSNVPELLISKELSDWKPDTEKVACPASVEVTCSTGVRIFIDTGTKRTWFGVGASCRIIKVADSVKLVAVG